MQCPIYAFPNFMSHDDCDILQAVGERQLAQGKIGIGCIPEDEGLDPRERSVLATFEERVSYVTGCEPHASDGKAVFKYASADTGCKDSSDEDGEHLLQKHKTRRLSGLPLGLHVDTHNDQLQRFASIILYLNTVPRGSGGETVFPHVRAAGETLLGSKITHTHTASRANSNPDVAKAATALLEAAQSVCCSSTSDGKATEEFAGADAAVGPPFVRRYGEALAVCPQKGLCILFYTRHRSSDGHVDPLSWHGGAKIADGCHKWILQKFKTVALPSADSCHKTTSSRVLSEQYIANYVRTHLRLPTAAESAASHQGTQEVNEDGVVQSCKQ
jgi:hypothetical protein